MVRDAVGESTLQLRHPGGRGVGVGAEEADLSRPEGVGGSTRRRAKYIVPYRNRPVPTDWNYRYFGCSWDHVNEWYPKWG